jgi:hypothetical protein
MDNVNSIGERIGEGNTAEIFLWPDGKILKLFRKGLPKEVCVFEYEATKKVFDSMGICPEPFQMIEMNERTGIIFEQINGKSMMDRINGHILSGKKYVKELALLQLSYQKSVDSILPGVNDVLRRNIGMVSELTSDEKEYLFQYIDSLPGGDALCHFDFHPGNVLSQGKKNVVIDWMTASIGNPLADAARTSYLIRDAETQIRPKILKLLINCIRKKLYRDYIREYAALSNVSVEAIEAWELPIMAARIMEWIPQTEKDKLLHAVHSQISSAKLLQH